MTKDTNILTGFILLTSIKYIKIKSNKYMTIFFKKNLSDYEKYNRKI